MASHSDLSTEMGGGVVGGFEKSLLNTANIWLNVPHYFPFELIFIFHSLAAKKAPLKFHVSHGPLIFMLADAICLIPHRNICILISPLDESTRNRGCIRKKRLLIILCVLS